MQSASCGGSARDPLGSQEQTVNPVKRKPRPNNPVSPDPKTLTPSSARICLGRWLAIFRLAALAVAVALALRLLPGTLLLPLILFKKLATKEEQKCSGSKSKGGGRVWGCRGCGRGVGVWWGYGGSVVGGRGGGVGVSVITGASRGRLAALAW